MHFLSPRFFVAAVVSAAVFLPSVSHASGFSNGASAIDALGQYDQTSLTSPVPVYTKGGANDGPNKLGFSLSGGNPQIAVDTVYHRLFVADQGNNRVLVYDLNADGTIPDRIPDKVLGQANFYSNVAATTRSGLRNPHGMVFDPRTNRLFVSDFVNRRIMAFDASRLVNGMDADYVLGQNSFTASGASSTRTGLMGPIGLAYDGSGSRLFVADYLGNRVLAYSGSSLSNGQAAAFVIGQSSFTASGAATTQAGSSGPFSVAYDTAGARLFVEELSNNRVTVYTGSLLSNGVNAAKVLGQSLFTTATAANSQSGLNVPRSIAYDQSGNRLFVAQDNRVMVFDVAAITDGENAVNILGQTSFVGTAAATTQSGLFQSRGVAYDSSSHYVYVAQAGVSRVSVFDVNSITDGENAVDLLGQYDDSSSPSPVYNKATANNGPNRLGMNGPRQMAIDHNHHRLFVPESGNNRVLVYTLDSSNKISSRVPTYVLGQPNFYSGAALTRATGMNQPAMAVYDESHDRLFVSEYGNNRVLVFSGASLSTGMAAAHVLGQPNFTSSTNVLTASGMAQAQGLAYDNAHNRLFVTSSSRHRVLVYDTTNISDGMNASYVLGQPNFTSSNGALTASGMFFPDSAAFDQSRNLLFIGQDGYFRVTAYDTSSIANGMNASYVLGQPNFTSNTASVSRSTFANIANISYDSATRRLFVGDYTANRITVFDTTSITNGMDASLVIGQSSFTTSSAATTNAGFSVPVGVYYDTPSRQLYVGDFSNNRVLAFDDADIVASSSSSESQGGGGGGTGGGRRTEPQAAVTTSSSKSSSSSVRSTTLSSSSSSLSPSPSSYFYDVPSSAWYFPYVTELTELNIVSGYKDANGNPLRLFGPSDNVTYAQLAKLSLGTAGESVTDQSGTDWVKQYLDRARALGYSVFIPSLDPNVPAARGAVVQTLLEALHIPLDPPSAAYSDVPATHPFAKAIATGTRLGLIQGDTNADGSLKNTFRPAASINRAELSKILILARQLPTQSASAVPAPSPTPPSDASSLSTVTTKFAVNVRSDPSMSGQILLQLPPNTTVELLSIVQSWAEVRLPDDRIGYMIRSLLK